LGRGFGADSAEERKEVLVAVVCRPTLLDGGPVFSGRAVRWHQAVDLERRGTPVSAGVLGVALSQGVDVVPAP
jgi:hypothetical protein